MKDENDGLDLVWGVEEIGRLIGRNYQQTFYMIRGGKLPMVQKIGERYVASRKRLVAFFMGEAA